jgi:hypothetical protein
MWAMRLFGIWNFGFTFPAFFFVGALGEPSSTVGCCLMHPHHSRAAGH